VGRVHLRAEWKTDVPILQDSKAFVKNFWVGEILFFLSGDSRHATAMVWSAGRQVRIATYEIAGVFGIMWFPST
jgi:hypothetical protein